MTHSIDLTPIEEMIARYEAKSLGFPVNQNLDLGVVFGYFRIARHMVNGSMVKTIDVASIESREEGKGMFTRFITALENLAASRGYHVYVESIVNLNLERMLKKRGYSFIDHNSRAYYVSCEA